MVFWNVHECVLSFVKCELKSVGCLGVNYDGGIKVTRGQ